MNRFSENIIEHIKRHMEGIKQHESFCAQLKKKGFDPQQNSPQQRALNFELVYAYLLNHFECDKFDYEYTTIRDTNVDFHFCTKDYEWFVELVNIDDYENKYVCTDDEESKQLTSVTMKITQKIIRNGQPIKFYKPKDYQSNKRIINIIWVNPYNFYLNAIPGHMDWCHYLNLMYGAESAINFVPHLLNNNPFIGLFEKRANHPIKNIDILQNQVHFIVFDRFESSLNCIKSKYYWHPNPLLLQEKEVLPIRRQFPFPTPIAISLLGNQILIK